MKTCRPSALQKAEKPIFFSLDANAEAKPSRPDEDRSKQKWRRSPFRYKFYSENFSHALRLLYVQRRFRSRSRNIKENASLSAPKPWQGAFFVYIADFCEWAHFLEHLRNKTFHITAFMPIPLQARCNPHPLCAGLECSCLPQIDLH
jgi:hypothetical protein